MLLLAEMAAALMADQAPLTPPRLQLRALPNPPRSVTPDDSPSKKEGGDRVPSPFDASTWDATVKGGYAPPEGFVDPVRQARLQQGPLPEQEVGDLLKEQAMRWQHEQRLRAEAGMSVDREYIDPRSSGPAPQQAYAEHAEPCDECLPALRRAQLIGLGVGLAVGAGLIGVIVLSLKGKSGSTAAVIPAITEPDDEA